MYCKALDKEFDNKAQMFSELKASKSVLIDKKKSEVKKKDNSLIHRLSNPAKGIAEKEGFVYPVISNTNYLDSHDDVHLNGSMTKTINEQSNKVYYLADHKLEVNNIIATPKNVNILLKTVNWADLLKSYEGQTQLMLFEINKQYLMHDKAIKMIEQKEALQNSIRMQYVTLDMAINSNDEAYKEEYKVWQEVYPQIANKDKADEAGYFFAVRELKIIKEGSMVLFGSNDATPIDQKEAVNDTSNYNEPSEDTQSINELLTNVKINLK